MMSILFSSKNEHEAGVEAYRILRTNLDFIINKIKEKGNKASRTQFALQGIKSDISYDELVDILKD